MSSISFLMFHVLVSVSFKIIYKLLNVAFFSHLFFFRACHNFKMKVPLFSIPDTQKIEFYTLKAKLCFILPVSNKHFLSFLPGHHLSKNPFIFHFSCKSSCSKVSERIEKTSVFYQVMWAKTFFPHITDLWTIKARSTH